MADEEDDHVDAPLVDELDEFDEGDRVDSAQAPDFNPASWHGKALQALFAPQPRGMPVQNSDDLERVLKLERRPVVAEGSPTAEALVELEMSKYSRGVPSGQCRCAQIDKRIAAGKRKCLTRLKWQQAWALYEMRVVGGLVASAPVGLGKTLISIVGALALKNCTLALLMIPSTLRRQIIIDYQLIAEHFYVPNFVVHLPNRQTWRSDAKFLKDGRAAPTVHCIPYTFLSSTRNSQWIENLRPNAIICDEVDALADIESSRTMRVLRYFDQHYATTKFCGWTGSLTDNSVSEFAHLYAFALQHKSPLPLNRETIDEWARCLDAVPNPCPPGALTRLLEPHEQPSQIRKAFHRRLAETPGIIMIGGRQIIRTDAGDIVENDIREKVVPTIPQIVVDALKQARDFIRPDTLVGDEEDEILVDVLEQAKVVRQIATGVFYRWNWDGVPDALARRWLAARKAWHAELRLKMLRGEAQLDSPKLCENAARRAWGDAPRSPELPEWRAENWPAWRDVKDLCKPRTEAKWLDKWLVHDVAEWAANNRGIIWYGMVEFAEELGRLTGLPVYGEDSAKEIAEATGEQTIIASIKSHGRGTNGLQFIYDQHCIVNTFASARMYQQCLDSKTEILTNKGWLGIDANWSQEDVQVAAYNIDDTSITWSRAERFVRLLGDEEMYGIQNPHLDIRVTAGHRMIVEPMRMSGKRHESRTTSYGPRQFVTASTMPRHGRLPLCGSQIGSGLPLSDDELVFLGLFMSDGNFNASNGTVRLFQSERYPYVIELIERTLRNCAFKYGHHVETKDSNFGARSPLHVWTISRWSRKNPGVGLRGWDSLTPYIDKEWSSRFDDMTSDQLRLFLMGFWAGDGQKTAGTYSYDPHTSHTMSIATRRQSVADGLQSLCVRRGLRCNVAQARPEFWIVHISDDQTWSVQTRAGDNRPRWRVVASDPLERVWCVEVDTGAIVTRRNGKVAVVGNCLGRLARDGQQSAVVGMDVYLHTRELRATFEQALRRGEYVQDITTEEQMLLRGWRGYASALRDY